MPQQSFTCKDQPDLTIPLDTPVPARLKDLRIESYEWDGKTIDKLLWYFEVLDPAYRDLDGNPRVVRGQCPPKLTNHPANKFRMWAEGLLGREIPVNMTVTFEDLIGLQCSITVMHEKDRKDPTMIWDRVEYVLPATDTVQPPF